MNTPSWKLLELALSEAPSLDGLRQSAGHVNDWQSTLTLASRHGVLPQLRQALQQLGTAVPLPVREQLRGLCATETLRVLQLDGERRRLTALLLAAGIPVIPWKGPVLAEQLYGDLSLRSCVDLDLLVPPEQGWQALRLLLAHGYDPGLALSARRWPALRRAVNHLGLVHAERGWLVELHWRLFHPLDGWAYDLAAHWRALTAGGVAREGRLDAGELLVLLSVHGAVHRWEKLKWVVDVDRLVRNSPQLDWEAVLALAGRMGSRRVLLLGLTLARDLCNTPLPEKLALKASREPLVARLAAEVSSAWFADPPRQKVPREYLFHLRCYEQFHARLLWVLRQLFAPRLADWQLFPPGSFCFPLFYLERPLRMAWKWGGRCLPSRRPR